VATCGRMRKRSPERKYHVAFSSTLLGSVGCPSARNRVPFGVGGPYLVNLMVSIA